MAAVQPHSIVASATEERSEEPAAMKEQTSDVGHEKEAVGQLRSFGSDSDLPVYMPNVYAPNAHASYFTGYENFPGEWNELSLYGNNSGWNRESPGIYNHNAALGFHNGYNYNPNMPCGPYCSVTTSLPVTGDASLYQSQQYAYSGTTYYQQVVSPSIAHITSQSELNVPAEQRADPILQGQRAGYSASLASSRRGNYTGNLGEVSFQDQQQGCDGFRYSGLSSDWPKPSEKHQPLTLGSQQRRSPYGFGSSPYSCRENTYERGLNRGFSGGCHGFNYGSRCGAENGSLCSCTGASDILTEQNRGPRALKSQRQIMTGSYVYTGSNRDVSIGKIRDASYNHPDFVIEHKDARFFVIKSYSEDNIHKSIKYGVWASTPNGNQKLNAAYHEAKEKLINCPIFLFFSANASAQFCGVAEMVGPVDFEKSVDYWQQDKWSGQFPVKWHIVKDVPNSQFRHIVLENNDNKPVTNSRDTQEVKLDQGVEMLNIFKNYETSISILDDFDFYEERQKVLQERKSREHPGLVGGGMVGGTEIKNVVTVPNEFIEKMTKSFAQVVQLNPCSKDISMAGRRSDIPLVPGQEVETAIVTVSPGVNKT